MKTKEIIEDQGLLSEMELTEEDLANLQISQPSKMEKLKIDTKQFSTLDLCLVFTSFQSSRVHWYKEFDRLFKEYIKGEIEFENYNKGNEKLREELIYLKEQSLTLIENLKDKNGFNREDIATIMISILSYEKQLVELVAKEQTSIMLEKVREADYSDEIKSIKLSCNEVREKIGDLMIDLHELMALMDDTQNE